MLKPLTRKHVFIISSYYSFLLQSFSEPFTLEWSLARHKPYPPPASKRKLKNTPCFPSAHGRGLDAACNYAAQQAREVPAVWIPNKITQGEQNSPLEQGFLNTVHRTAPSLHTGWEVGGETAGPEPKRAGERRSEKQSILRTSHSSSPQHPRSCVSLPHWHPFFADPPGSPPPSHLTRAAHAHVARSPAAARGAGSPFGPAASPALAPRRRQHLRRTPSREPPRSSCFRFPRLAGSLEAISGKAWIWLKPPETNTHVQQLSRPTWKRYKSWGSRQSPLRAPVGMGFRSTATSRQLTLLYQRSLCSAKLFCFANKFKKAKSSP